MVGSFFIIYLYLLVEAWVFAAVVPALAVLAAALIADNRACNSADGYSSLGSTIRVVGGTGTGYEQCGSCQDKNL